MSADPLAKDEDMQYTLRAHDHVMLADLQYENMVNTQKKLDSLSVKFEHPLYKARHKLIFGDHSDESKRTVLESQDGMFSEEVTLQDGSTFQRDVVPTENGYLVIMNYLPNTGEPSQSFSITAEIDNDSLTIRTVMPGDICEHIYEPRMSKIPFAALGTKFIDAVNEHGPYTTTVDIVSAEVITPDDVKWGTAPARSTEFVGIVGGVDKKVTVTESEGKINVAESFF